MSSSFISFAAEETPRYTYTLGIYNKFILQKDLPRPPKPIFWEADLLADFGSILSMEKNLYKISESILIDWGLSFCSWGVYQKNEVYKKQYFHSFSIFLSSRFYLFTYEKIRPFLYYSIGGPSYISEKEFASTQFSNNFVFQDQLGLGLSFSNKPSIEISLRIFHYSNGDLFPINGGIDVPIVLGLGFKI
ncbi:MAG: hypothetical protein CMP11_05055 [Zetaproteobacteria bacterium]|nr:hypothetical protein [Pseudobdellovibrionaceae bacterium]